MVENSEDYIVYLIINKENNFTYVGITNNPERRIRQHNGILKGGARYTESKRGNGIWEYYGFILGLDKSTALSIEKKIHIYSRKTYGSTPLERRINCINKILIDYPLFQFILL
jgi:predicted GIY-YIG superfamily endonuclease